MTNPTVTQAMIDAALNAKFECHAPGIEPYDADLLEHIALDEVQQRNAIYAALEAALTQAPKQEHAFKLGPWTIHYDPPPIPTRNCDWHYTHEDDDGAPDGSCARSGHAESLQGCLDAIFELIEEQMS